MSDAKPEAKPEVKSETKIESKPEVKTENKLQILKTKADTLGIKYTNTDTEETLYAKVKAAMEDAEKVSEPKAEPEAKEKTPAQIRLEAIREATKLIRVRITNMDPRKSDLPGEIFTVANSLVGEVRRYIPYGEQHDGWHVEQILLDFLKEKEFYQLRTRKSPNGEIRPDGRWVKEFNIELLPPLTKEELKTLANKQAAAAGQGY